MFRLSLITSLLLLPVASMAQTIGAQGESIDEHGIIIEAPADAEIRQYERNGMYLYYNDADGLTYTVDQLGSIDIAICPDGTLFFKDLVSSTHYGTWVKGTRRGDDIIIKAGQKLYWSEQWQATISLQCYDIEFEVNPSSSPIVFRSVIEPNGREMLQLQNCDTWSHSVGSIWDDDQSVDQLGDYATELIFDPNNSDSELNEPVVIPASVEMKEYVVDCWSYRNDRYVRYTVLAGFDGDDMYISGLYNFEPGMNLKGHRQDGMVTFPRYQYMGNDGTGAPIYAVAVGYGVDEDGIAIFVDADQWTLTYNAATHKYEGGECCVRFARNPYYKYGNMYESIDEIFITPPADEGIADIKSDADCHLFFDTMGRQLDPAHSHGFVIEVSPSARSRKIIGSK